MVERTGSGQPDSPPSRVETAPSVEPEAPDSRSVDSPEGAEINWGRSVASGGIALLAGNVVASAGFFIAVLLLARGLAPAERGTIAFITVTAQVLARIAGTGTPQATAVLGAQRPSDRPVLLVNVFAYVFVVAGLVAVLACSAMWLLGDLAPAGVGGLELVLLALGTLAVALSEAGYGFLLGCTRFRQQMRIQMIVPWLYAILLGVVQFGSGLTVARAALVWTVAMGSGAALLVPACLRGVGIARPDLGLVAGSIRFGLRAWVGSLCNVLNFRADQMLMGFIATEASLGVYAVAVNGAEVLLYLPAALSLALVPAIARSEAEARAERALLVFRIVSVVTLPLVVLAAVFGPALLPAVFGSAYEDSVAPFLWLLPGTFGFVAISVLSNTLLASGAPGLGSVPPFVALVVGLGLDLALIPRYGATGAAIAATTAYLLGGAVALVAHHHQSRFSWSLAVPRMSDLAVLRRFVVQFLRSPAR